MLKEARNCNRMFGLNSHQYDNKYRKAPGPFRQQSRLVQPVRAPVFAIGHYATCAGSLAILRLTAQEQTIFVIRKPQRKLRKHIEGLCHGRLHIEVRKHVLYLQVV